MRKILIFILLVLSSTKSSMGQDNLWLYGSDSFSPYSQFGGSSIDFISGSAIVLQHPRQMNFLMTNANISDSQGNLLFYTNGISIQNSDDNTMLNGDSLSPGVYTSLWQQTGLNMPQAALILPSPADSNLFFVFHETLDPDTIFGSGPALPLNLFYSVVDMRLDGGKGAVVLKNQVLLSDSLFIGGLTAVRHGNGKEWWILVRKYNSESFYKILLNDQGGFNVYSDSVSGLPHSMDQNQNAGQCVFSPDGSKYAFYIASYGLGILDFDRCSGEFKNFKYLPRIDTMWCGGVAFSPNSKLLYVSSSLYLYQLDLSNSSSTPVFDTIAVYDNFYDSLPNSTTTFFLGQLALDGKIYINSWAGVRYLSVINNPDSVGLSCNFTQHSFSLQTYNSFTIPNHPNFRLGALSGSICDSINAVETILSDFDGEISPNPSNESLHLKFHENFAKVNLKIFSTEGKSVFVPVEKISDGFKLNISSLQNGLYLISVVSESGTKVFKFIKN